MCSLWCPGARPVPIGGRDGVLRECGLQVVGWLRAVQETDAGEGPGRHHTSARGRRCRPPGGGSWAGRPKAVMVIASQWVGSPSSSSVGLALRFPARGRRAHLLVGCAVRHHDRLSAGGPAVHGGMPGVGRDPQHHRDLAEYAMEHLAWSRNRLPADG